MNILLHIALENACSGGLVETGGLQDVGGIDPIVLSTAHNMLFEVWTELVLVHGNLECRMVVSEAGQVRQPDKLTPL